MSAVTVAAPATRARMLVFIAGAGHNGLPVPHTITLTGPDEQGGYATLWLAHGDTGGVDRWVDLLVSSGAAVDAGPGLDGRRYPVTGGSGHYRVYRASLDAEGWQVNINCQVIA